MFPPPEACKLIFIAVTLFGAHDVPLFYARTWLPVRHLRLLRHFPAATPRTLADALLPLVACAVRGFCASAYSCAPSPMPLPALTSCAPACPPRAPPPVLVADAAGSAACADVAMPQEWKCLKA